MKDIDFDELDRAVSSVLGQKASDAEPKSASTPVSSSSTEPTSEKAQDEPTAEVVEAVETKPSGDTLTPAKTTPLAIKRRGKFMDVMHPSADMQPTVSSSSPSPIKTTRTAPVITPLLTEETEPTPEAVEEPQEPIADLDESASLIGAEPVLVDGDIEKHDLNGTADAPDTDVAPDDEADTNDTQQDTPLASSETSSDSLDEQVDVDAQETASSEPTSDEPQSTPFLTDTQVEKRPLGAFGEAEASEQPSETEELSGLPDADLTPAAVPAALPRELQPDVVNVESVQEAEAEQAAASSSSGSTVMASPFAAKVGVAPEATDGRVEGHPLFDTSTYHEPIATVHSHGLPTWAKWALGLLGCLVIGAGVGYFLFTAGL